MNGNGHQGLERVVHTHRTSYNIVLELLAERAWCTISILAYPHQVGSSSRSFHLLLQRFQYLFTLRQGVEENCLICDDPFSISASTLVPRAFWGAWARGPGGSEDTGFKVLNFRTSGHFRIKSKLGDSLFKIFESRKFTVIDTWARVSDCYILETLKKSRGNHLPYVWTEVVSLNVFVLS